MFQIIPQIILASQSVPRKQLLERLKIQFTVIPANIDETPLINEQPLELVERLSKQKAQAVLNTLKNNELKSNCLIISSDQVAVFQNRIYGKPGDFARAKAQLELFNNNTLEFITGLCVCLNSNNQQEMIYDYEISKIKLKNLNEAQISNYLHKEQPYEAAASFKIESLGISLVEQMQSADYTAIIGLPLLKLTAIFEQVGFDILK